MPIGVCFCVCVCVRVLCALCVYWCVRYTRVCMPTTCVLPSVLPAWPQMMTNRGAAQHTVRTQTRRDNTTANFAPNTRDFSPCFRFPFFPFHLKLKDSPQQNHHSTLSPTVATRDRPPALSVPVLWGSG
uniref:Putative secreted peptide n=1 Tax=Anopheles braziliensis TaxID=58242 RepID=A0A2M3ZW27_9DIPT